MERDGIGAVSGDSTLRATGLEVTFEGVRALRGLNLSVDPNEVVGLIGPNGSGKTTCLNVLTGFVRPTAGSVTFGRREITRWSPDRRARVGIIRTFQGVRLFPWLTVLENLEVAAISTGARRPEARRTAARLVVDFELQPVSGTLCQVLPAGLARRAGIARAIAAKPVHLLLDEPAAGMNETEVGELVELVSQLPRDYGVGMLLVEHDMTVIKGCCARVHVLDAGATLFEGDVDLAIRDTEVRRAYFGEVDADAA